MEVLVDDKLDCGNGSWSLEEGGSNEFILQGSKKTRKRKGLNKENEKLQINKKPKVSKSQQRKMKKLEEEKEKALLLSKSLETLEKYKLPDEAFSLLRSSRFIGQDETRLEKRSRAVQLSRAGVPSPANDWHLDKRSSNCTSSLILPGHIDVPPEINGKGDLAHQMIEERVIFSDGDVSDSPRESDTVKFPSKPGGSLANLPAEKVNNGNICISMADNEKNSGHASCVASGAKDTDLMDRENEKPKVDFCQAGNQQEFTAQRPMSAPTVVHVSRPNEVEEKRQDLPIVMMEQEIMEAINENTTVIICGETGCGKTTQVPQFLYEAGFGSNKSGVQGGIIGVTQPRRVAVLATAKRVAYELGLRLGKEVGFQVRYDKNIGESCSIKMMTDGILLREIQEDILLKRYSVIIIDEAHERSLNTDILIGILSRTVEFRQDLYKKQQQMVSSGKTISSESLIAPLKLVLMSATLRVEDFCGGRLFRVPPPVIEVPTRQFPVTVHFSKRTDIDDYTGKAYKMVMEIHKKLPPGGVLVFVTGQREVEDLCKKLRAASRKLIKETCEVSVGNDGKSISEMASVQGMDMKEIKEAFETQEDSTDHYTNRFGSCNEDSSDIHVDWSDGLYDSETESELEIFSEEEDLIVERNRFDNGDNLVDALGEGGSLVSLKAAFEALAGNCVLNIEASGEQIDPAKEGCSDKPNVSKGSKLQHSEVGFCAGALRVLPLYAMLPATAQLCVFEEVEEGERLVVVATNVAETSLTIPGIKYVVDTGREKVKIYDPSTGMESYEIQWISKASAAQRAGRAGRTGPGHCYRLYSSAAFSNTFSDFSLTEIVRVPVDGVVLLMKSMGIDKVVNFPFPTPPETTSMVEAERCLKALEALDSNGRLTPIGKAMAHYPMSPRHSRMLLTVIQIMRKVESYARANLLLAYGVAAAAALSMSSPYVFERIHTEDGQEHEERSYDVACRKDVEQMEKLKKKKLKEASRVSRARFLNPSSDALTIAYALQCFENSENHTEFCEENALHQKTMEEMSKMRKQLLQLVFNQSRVFGAEQNFSWIHGTLKDVEDAWKVSTTKHPLLLNEEEILGQAICAGWADRVAKRVRVTSGLAEGEVKVHADRYQATMVKETVFLHRISSVCRSAPEFLVYSELLRTNRTNHTNRPYMHGVTSVKPDWLVTYARSLCTLSAPLTDPKPYYEPQTDQVFSWFIPTFGPHLWELPLHSLPIENKTQRIAVFAYALLEGQVLPCLKSVRKFMAAPPASILRPEALGQKRVGNLLSKLKTRSISSSEKLRLVWKENPHELHSEILNWFQEGFRARFEELWLQMLSEVSLEPQERFPKRLKKSRRKI